MGQPTLEDGLDPVAGQDHLTGSRRRQHDVCLFELMGESVERDRTARNEIRYRPAPVGVTVGDDHLAGEIAPPGERLHDPTAHLPCSHDEEPPPVKTESVIGSKLHDGVSERSRTPLDRRLATGSLAGFDRVPEQRAEHGTCRLLYMGILGGVTHLAKDLALTEHRRVDPGSDLEQVRDGSVVVPADEPVTEVDDAAARRGALLAPRPSVCGPNKPSPMRDRIQASMSERPSWKRSTTA